MSSENLGEKFDPRIEPAGEARNAQLHETQEACTSLSDQILKEKIEAITAENTLPGDVDASVLKTAQSDESRLEGFETIAFLIALYMRCNKDNPDSFIAKFRSFFDFDDNENERDNAYTADDVDRFMQPEKETRRKIVQTALGFCGSTQFRGEEVDGGNLACAQVATTILQQSGLLDRQYTGVSTASRALQEKGWKKHAGPPRPGDVVVWKRSTKKDPEGNVVLGHGHIGVVINGKEAVNNSSRKKMPVITTIEQKRGVEFFLSPPEAA